MGCKKEYLEHSRSSASLVTSFKIIQKLTCRIFCKLWAVRKNIYNTQEVLQVIETSFKIILKFVEFFTSCGMLKKIFRTLRKFCKFWNFIQNYPKACTIFCKLWDVEKIFRTLRKFCKFWNFIQNHPKGCRILYKLWAVKKYLEHSGSSASLVTSFKINLKFVQFFASCGMLKKIFRTLRKFCKFWNFIQNHPKGCRILYKLWAVKKYLEHSGSSASLVTSFKINLKLVEFFTSCGLLKKIFRTLRMFCKFWKFIQNHPKACRILRSCGL